MGIRRRRRWSPSLRFYVSLDIVLLILAALAFRHFLDITQEQTLKFAENSAQPPVTAPSPTWVPRPTETRKIAPQSPTRTILSPPGASTPPLALPAASLPPLLLRDIFPPRALSNFGLDPQRLRTIVVTGDVVPARSTDAMIRENGDNFALTISDTRNILSGGDLTIVNLEAPLVKNCPPHESGFKLCGRPGFTTALKQAGVDIVTLENNHIGNYGYAGIVETTRYLTGSGLLWADRYTPVIAEVRGLKVGIVAFNGVGERFEREDMRNQIRTVRPKVDVLIAAIHWGAEYVFVPQSAPGIAPDDPMEIAHYVIDSGADLIIGNHPHWVQGVEIYKGKLITYAHGNFIFDQMWSYETRVGVIGRYTFLDRTLARVEFIPTIIQDYGRPVPLQGREAQAVLDRMKAASLAIASKTPP